MICYLFEAPSYLIFAPDIPELLYYSHIPATVIALIVGAFVYFNNKSELKNRLLFIICVCFALWTTASLLAWTNINSDFLLFIWPLFGVLAAFISIFSVYFIHVFLTKEDVTWKIKLIYLALLLPVLLFAHTDLSLSGFNLTSCDAFEYEGMLYKTYYTTLSYIAMTWIFALLIKYYRTATKEMRIQIMLMGIGIEFFLFSFITTTSLVAYLSGIHVIPDSSLELYSLFSMTIFMVMVGVLIVRFESFNIGTHAANALVVALLILVGSQFTYSDTPTSIALTAITLLLTLIAGLIIIRSVKKEIEQREHIEQLVEKLEKANKRLKILDHMKSEFVSIASHQLRSPLTSIRGYASMLLEGSYGKLSQKGKEAIERIAESSRYMALSVEDYLNVSRIEAGRMKYEMSDFNLKEIVEKIVDDVRPAAVKKGLLLTFKSSNLDSKGMVYGDIGKTQQIIHNLLDNSIKYTPEGSITVTLDDNKKKKRVYVEVTDTGVGMDKETTDEVFEKFIRARNANEVNVTGTGLGLYVARQMAEGMKGTITAVSAGKGKGSTFTLELPMAK